MGRQNNFKKFRRANVNGKAESLDFERAKEYRDLIQHIQNLTNKQKIMSSDKTIRDVFGYSVDKGWMCIQVFFIYDKVI